MKAISHFIRQFRCWLRKPGASTAADTSAPVSQPQGHSPWGSALPQATQHHADHSWQHGERNQRGLQGTRVPRLLLVGHPAPTRCLGTVQPAGWSARSQLSLAVLVNSRTIPATTALLGLAVPFSPGQPPCSRWVPLLRSFPAHCSPAAPVLPSWHPAVRGRVWVWEPGLGASLAAVFLSRLPAAWVPQQSQRAHRHLGTQPSSPRSRCLHLEMCFAAPHPARSHRRVPRDRHAPQSRGERSLTCHHPALRHVAGLAPCTLGTRLCAVTPHGWTLSKCLHVQDMNQPGRECSSRSWTTRAARQAAPAARLCWC